MGALSGNALNVQGTGQNVGQLKQQGWTPQELQQAGQQGMVTQNPWQKMLQGGLAGTAQGLGAAPRAPANNRAPQKANNPYFYGYGQGQ